MPDAKISDLPAGGDPQDDDAFVVARGATNVSLAWSSLSNAATQNNVALTISGNTAGAGALVSTGTLTLAGGNNITLSQAGNAVTISGAAAAGAQTAISGISASDTLYTSGTVRFTGSQGATIRSGTGQLVVVDVPATSSLSATGAVSISTNGSTISIGAPAQTEQTQNVVDVTLDGNTAGALALISSGTMTLAGGNNITVSQAGNAVTISGPNVGGAQTGISALANSETTYTSGSVTFSELGAITIRSTTGQQFQFSVNPQSVQPETQTFIAGISASDTLYTSGNVRFTGVGGGVTVSSNTGQRVDISVAAQSVQPETQTFIGGIRNSETTYTSGTVNLSVNGGLLTIRSTTGQAFQFSVSQSVQPETQTAISGIANSQTTYTSGTVSLSELGAITIRSTTGNQYQFSVNSQTVQTQGVLSVGVSTGGNTSGNTTVNTGSRFVIVGSNGITASQGTAAGATTVTLSGITQSVQTQDVLSIGVSTGGNTAGNTTVNTGSRFVIVGSNGITASQGTAAGATTVTLSGVTQSVQTQGVPNMGVSTGGNTSGDTTVNSGTRMVFVGSNNITLSQGTAANATTITISGPTTAAQTVQTQGIVAPGVSTGGNTAGDTGVASGTRFILVGTNMVSLSQTTGANATTVSINATNQNLSAGVSNVGNTSGNTTVNTGSRLVFAGGNNITVSQGTAAGATTITISAPNLGAGAFSGGASNLGNTAGATGITGTQLVFVGSDNITLSQTTGANGGTLSIIGPAAGGFSAGVSTGGNTAGDTGVTGTRLVFVGVSPISLSQATAAAGGTVSVNAPATSSLSATGLVSISTNGSTISIGVPGTTASGYDRWGAASKVVGALPGQATLAVQPWQVLVPYQHDRVIYPVHYSQATNSTLTVTVSAWFGLYTKNVSTLSLLSSASGTFSINGSGTASSAQNSGIKYLTFGWTNTVTPGDYWLGAISRTTTAGANASLSNVLVNLGLSNSGFSGIMGVALNNSNQLMLGLGTYTATTSAMPSNIPFASMTGTGSGAHRVPWVWFLSESV